MVVLFPAIIIIVDVLTLGGVVDVRLCGGVETVELLFKFVAFFAFPSESIRTSIMLPALDVFLLNSIVPLVLFIVTVVDSWFIVLLVMLWISDLLRLPITGIN